MSWWEYKEKWKHDLVIDQSTDTGFLSLSIGGINILVGV